MNKKGLFCFLFLCLAGLVYSQEEEVKQLLNLLDNVRSTATGVGRASAASGQPDPEVLVFNIRNKTGYTVKSVYISAVNTGNWGGNVLFRNLSNNGSSRISLRVPLSETNRYDIRLVDEDGTRYEKYNVEISGFTIIEVDISNLKE